MYYFTNVQSSKWSKLVAVLQAVIDCERTVVPKIKHYNETKKRKIHHHNSL